MTNTPTADLGGEFSIAAVAGTVVVDLKDKRQYRCPVHGTTTNSGISGVGGTYFGSAIDRTPHLSVAVGPKEKQGYYCLLCYADWIHATFPKLEEVKP